MKQRVMSLLLVLALLAGVLAVPALADKINFSDIRVTDWYYSDVMQAVSKGLVNGKTATTYEPNSFLTLAETVKLSACLHQLYHEGSVTLTNGNPWYLSYAKYAQQNGITTYDLANNSAIAGTNVTREAFVAVLYQALPEHEYAIINKVVDNAIPDYSGTDSLAREVYTFYRAGILTGSNGGYFYPEDNIKRSEVAAILIRMLDKSVRKSVTLTQVQSTKPTPITTGKVELNAEQVYAADSQAVFYIEVYDGDYNCFATGSGFIVDESGIAVTNYHVIEGASAATIFLGGSGQGYAVAGVCGYDIKNDWAVLKIEGSGFPALTVGDPSTVLGGSTVYAIGSPLGLDNTISQGIISNPNRVDEGVSYIQFSAPISSGSSGGALINKYGEVIGITSASYVDGQNLNLAVPMSDVSLSAYGLSTLYEVAVAEGAVYSAYGEYEPNEGGSGDYGYYVIEWYGWLDNEPCVLAYPATLENGGEYFNYYDDTYYCLDLALDGYYEYLVWDDSAGDLVYTTGSVYDFMYSLQSSGAMNGIVFVDYNTWTIREFTEFFYTGSDYDDGADDWSTEYYRLETYYSDSTGYYVLAYPADADEYTVEYSYDPDFYYILTLQPNGEFEYLVWNYYAGEWLYESATPAEFYNQLLIQGGLLCHAAVNYTDWSIPVAWESICLN